MDENNSGNGCCLGIAGIIVCGVLTCLAPGFLLTALIACALDLSSSQVWGFSLAISTVVFFILKFLTNNAIINYVKTCILCTIIIVVLALVMSNDSFMGKTLEKITPSNGTSYSGQNNSGISDTMQDKRIPTRYNKETYKPIRHYKSKEYKKQIDNDTGQSDEAQDYDKDNESSPSIPKESAQQSSTENDEEAKIESESLHPTVEILDSEKE